MSEDAPLHPVTIEATAYVRLHVPEDLPPGPAACVVAVHGYGQDPEAMLAFARAVATDGALVVAPQGPQDFYAERWSAETVGKRRIGHGWIAAPANRPDAEARNRDFLGKALDLAAEHAPLDPARTFLVGYSQGVGVCADFAVHARERVAGLVGLAGGVPGANRPALGTLTDLPVLWVTGERDRFYTPEYSAKMVEVLTSAGVALETESLAPGHALLDDARGPVRTWLARQS